MTEIKLVRHGQASFGAKNYDVLSPTGQRQAQILGARLQNANYKPVAVFTGRMQRQQNTAIHAGFTQFTVDPAFDEFDFQGVLQHYLPVVASQYPDLSLDAASMYANPRQFVRVFDAAMAMWHQQATGVGSQPESFADFQQRVSDGIHRISTARDKNDAVLVFTSGGVISLALQAALCASHATAWQLNQQIYNASVHTIRKSKSGYALTRFNDIAHLEFGGDPSLITQR